VAVDEQTFVVGVDGHVLSEKELQEARRLDEPGSTGDAPDTRAETTLPVNIDRARGQIEMFTRRLEGYRRGPDNEDWRKREYTKARLAKLEAHFLAPIQASSEASSWRTYLDESRRDDANEGRAAELATTLAAESLLVQRVARWRRRYPAGKWAALREWLTDDQIREAVARLKSLNMLKGKELVVG